MNSTLKLPAIVIGATLLGVPLLASAAAPASSSRHASLRAQVQDADAKVAAAKAQNTALQAQVTQLEQQTEAQQKQLQQRDADIAALQAQLKAAGVSAPASASGS